MKIEGPAFLLGGGPALLNRDGGGVPMRRFGGVFALLMVGVLGASCLAPSVSKRCVSSMSSSSAPSFCGRCGFDFGEDCGCAACSVR